MAGIEGLMKELPIGDIAQRLGVDEATAKQAIDQALPTLFGGLKANAQDPAGERSIAEAVSQHPPSLVEGGVNLSDVDESDGEKIVSHVFGDNKQQVVQTLGGLPKGGGKALQEKLLPILAPIVLSYLAKQLGGKGGKGAGGLGGVLGDILGSAAGGGKGGGGVGDILGDLLGGGGAKGKGGGVGDILGGLLGGGRR
ncbi:MAG TPA: DUF937 domain-containing protein [Actinomycetota bacterium]|nr:DUF937 domain-containing protein [Actinomycetota bacterium]